MKRTAEDARWSDLIRARANWTCQRCHKWMGRSQGLHACHLFSRGIKKTRCDPENGFAACYGCHRFLDGHPLEKTKFAIKLLGQEQYDQLMIRAKRIK